MEAELTGIELSAGRADDIEALRETDRQCFGHTWTATQYANILADPRSVVLVVRHHGRPVGHGWLQINDDGGYIPTIGLLPPYRGRGLGGRLLDSLLEAGRRRGVRSVTLEVRVAGKAARRLYLSRGFVVIGMRRGLYTNPVDDALVMRWEAPDDASQS